MTSTKEVKQSPDGGCQYACVGKKIGSNTTVSPEAKACYGEQKSICIWSKCRVTFPYQALSLKLAEVIGNHFQRSFGKKKYYGFKDIS